MSARPQAIRETIPIPSIGPNTVGASVEAARDPITSVIASDPNIQSRTFLVDNGVIVYIGQSLRSEPISLETPLEITLNELAAQWRGETMSMSSLYDKFLHPAYLQIIGMGKEAVPWLLREVQRMSGQWFLALRSITRQDPVTDKDSISVRDMAGAWLRWGRQQGYDV